jgi:hypothetical protein
MTTGNRYRGSRPGKKGGGGWFLTGFLILCALLLCYGQSQPIIRLREQIALRLEGVDFYEDAVAQVGKLFSGVEQESITSVFGQLFFGEEQAGS